MCISNRSGMAQQLRILRKKEFGVVIHDYQNSLSGSLPYTLGVSESLTMLLPYTKKAFTSNSMKNTGKWWAFADSNCGPADSGYQSFHSDLDYIITHSIICLGAGRYWCITRRDRAAPPSLCTFLSRLIGLAQDCHRHDALRFP